MRSGCKFGGHSVIELSQEHQFKPWVGLSGGVSLIAKKQAGRMVETPTEARQAEPGPSVLALLTISTCLAILILGGIWFAFFRRETGTRFETAFHLKDFYFGGESSLSSQPCTSDLVGSVWTCASWILPHLVHRMVQCSKPERAGIMRWTAIRAWHLGQRGRCVTRDGSSGDDCRSDMTLIPRQDWIIHKMTDQCVHF
jgi:hypothetical protein